MANVKILVLNYYCPQAIYFVFLKIYIYYCVLLFIIIMFLSRYVL